MKLYPLNETYPDYIKSYSGKSPDEITIEAIKKGQVTEKDIRISREALLLQAEVARREGRMQMAKSFIRSAEMIEIPDDRILEIYNMLRPNRSSKATLQELIRDLKTSYQAEMCAELVEETLEVYEKRGLLIESMVVE